MANTIRGVNAIRTISSLMDRRRARSSAGALLELSAMANEKQRLEQERDRLTRRDAEIRGRLAEIGEREARLLSYVKDPTASAVTTPGPAARRGVGPGNADAPVEPRFTLKEFSY